MRLHLPEDQYVLTAALPANRGILQYIPLQASAEYLDYINLMAYDFFGPWTHESGHHSQLYAMQGDEESGANGVQYVLSQGFPPGKILLGIPLYGRSFLGATGPGQAFKGAGGDDTGTFEYKNLPLHGTKEAVDENAVAAQCVGPDGGFVTYDSPDTVRTKAQFCKQKGLGVSGDGCHKREPAVRRRPGRRDDLTEMPFLGTVLLEWAGRREGLAKPGGCRLPSAPQLLSELVEPPLGRRLRSRIPRLYVFLQDRVTEIRMTSTLSLCR